MYWILYSLGILGTSGLLLLAYFYSLPGRNFLLTLSFLIIAGCGFIGMHLLLGKPVPINPVTSYLYQSVETGKVVYVNVNETENWIVLLLEIPGQKQPIYIVVPFTKELASKLQKLGHGDEDGTRPNPGDVDGDGDPGDHQEPNDEHDIEIEHPFDQSLETRPNDFHHGKAPSSRYPDKPTPEQETFH